ncbi:GFA family protein [Legionella israelensis]|nr:GFA family protein [Legionella israelensis]
MVNAYVKKFSTTCMLSQKLLDVVTVSPVKLKSGSDHIVYLAFEHDAVTLEGEVKWYTSIGDSGLPKQHGFCPECGANLFAKPEHWSHLLIVYAGSLIDSSNHAPQTNLWVKEAPKWSCMNESLISFEGNPG